MEISRKSWAYKVWKWNNQYNEPRDLCSFVRGMVWSFIKYAAIASFAAGAAAFLLFVALSPFMYSWFGMVDLEAPAVVAFFLYCCAFFFYLSVRSADIIQDIRYNRRTEYRKPGLVRSWYRAKKQKICPFITVTE